LLEKGRLLDPAALSLAASANHPVVSVVKRRSSPSSPPATSCCRRAATLAPDQIISSNAYGVAAAAQSVGRVRSTSASHPTARRRSPHW